MLLEEYQQSLADKLYFIFDGRVEGRDKMFIFETSHASQLLAAPDDWLADGMLKAWELWEMFP